MSTVDVVSDAAVVERSQQLEQAYLPYISAISPLYLPYISPISPLHIGTSESMSEAEAAVTPITSGMCSPS